MATPLTADELAPVISDLLKQHRRERPRLDRIAAYMRNRVRDIYVPRKATAEYKMLVDQSRFNVLPLVERSIVQNLFVDGYRPTAASGRAPDSKNSPIWDMVWQPNRMDARQAALYRPAVRYGYGYGLVLPGKPVPVITPYSPRKLTALYEDPVNDEWPSSAMVCRRRPISSAAPSGSDPLATPEVEEGVKLTIYDAHFRYHVVKAAGGWRLVTDAEEHGMGLVPVVRFLDEVGDEDDDDLEGVVSLGKIEPLLPTQRQLNQTTYSLLMAQHYAAFKQRWATGMKIEEDEAGGAPAEPFNPRVDAILQNEAPEGKFGEFSETDLSGYLNSRDKTLLFIAAVAQLPPHQLIVGAGISNISAEALAALESAHRHDIGEHQTSFGESVEQLLRLAGKAMGTEEGMAAWEDMSAQVVWRDTTPRSLAQVADALGKLAQQLGIPPRALWERIPGVTDQDIKHWEEMAREQEGDAEWRRILDEARQEVEEVAQGAVGDSEPADAAA